MCTDDRNALHRFLRNNNVKPFCSDTGDRPVRTERSLFVSRVNLSIIFLARPLPSRTDDALRRAQLISYVVPM